MRKIKVTLSLFMLLFLLIPAMAFGEPKIPAAPTSSIYVQDYAGIISDSTKAAINQIGTELAAKTKAQIVVVTVTDLQGYPIEDYSITLFRKWGIGNAKLNNGVLMLIAPNERKSRIEVGYGLEGALPDAKTGRIQDEAMLPYFKAGDYDSGIYNGYIRLVNEAAAEYKVNIDTSVQPVPQSQPSVQTVPISGRSLFFYGLLFFLFILLDTILFRGRLTRFLFYLFLFRGGRGGGGGFGSSGGGGSSRGW